MSSAYSQRIVHCTRGPIVRCDFTDICIIFQHIRKMLKMSSRFAKNGDKSADRSATGRPSGLREISYTEWREWDNHMVELKGYLRDRYPDMNTICPDPMKPDDLKPGYMVHKTRPLDKDALAKCGTDPEGLE